MTIQVITSLGQIKGQGRPGYGTALPASPNDGDEYVLVDSITAPTYQWRFRWNNGSSNADKWEFVGGSDALAAIEALETQGTSAYAALTTAGPSFTIPRAGQYVIALGCQAGGGGTSSMGWMSYDIGGTGASDLDGVRLLHASGVNYVNIVSIAREKQKTIAAASTALVSKYRNDSGTWNFQSRWLRVTPVRVS